MSTAYRIKFKIVEGPKLYSGTRIVDSPIDEYMRHVHKTYPEATYVYIELIEEIEVKDEEASASAEGLIILCLTNVQAQADLP
jgi:hypothetical protein